MNALSSSLEEGEGLGRRSGGGDAEGVGGEGRGKGRGEESGGYLRGGGRSLGGALA